VLTHRNNYVVAKAADLVRELALAELVPQLLVAFDRFFTEPVKTDPQCWAKNALSRALSGLEYHDAAVFLRGMRHIQLEPVWGGRSDTAGTLRGTCALALVQCRSLSETDLLNFLIELFSDKDKSVRVEVVRAIEQVGSASATLLLRLRAILAADEPEVLGACFSGIMHIEGRSAISWVSRFLATGDDIAAGYVRRQPVERSHHEPRRGHDDCRPEPDDVAPSPRRCQRDRHRDDQRQPFVFRKRP